MYTNVEASKKVAPIMTTVFCSKRILLALMTAYMNELTFMCAYFYTFSSLFSIGFFLNNKPMQSKMMNFMEIINEIAIYLTSYVIFFFSDWIDDIEMRYTLGFVYMPGIMIIVTFNLACVIYEMCSAIYTKLKAKFCKKKPKKVDKVSVV